MSVIPKVTFLILRSDERRLNIRDLILAKIILLGLILFSHDVNKIEK